MGIARGANASGALQGQHEHCCRSVWAAFERVRADMSPIRPETFRAQRSLSTADIVQSQSQVSSSVVTSS